MSDRSALDDPFNGLPRVGETKVTLTKENSDGLAELAAQTGELVGDVANNLIRGFLGMRKDAGESRLGFTDAVAGFRARHNVFEEQKSPGRTNGA